MRILIGTVLALATTLACGYQGDESEAAPISWGEMYIIDNCSRCPECCTPNDIAYLEDGQVCFAENYDRLSKGWTDEELHNWCETGIYPSRRISAPFFLKGTVFDPAQPKK